MKTKRAAFPRDVCSQTKTNEKEGYKLDNYKLFIDGDFVDARDGRI